MDTIIKHFKKVGIQKKLTLFAALLSLLFCLLILPLLYFQIVSLAKSQVQLFGQTMSRQLLGQVRQPLLNEDAVSLQVVLDNLVKNTPIIKQATVFKPGNHLFAESVEPSSLARLVTHEIFKQELNLPNASNWQVQLALDPIEIHQK